MFGRKPFAGKKESASESQFHDFFRKIPDAVIILEKTGILTEANEMAEELSGYGKGELIGQNIVTGLGLLDAKTKIICFKKLAMLFTGARVPPFEIEITRKDNKKIPLEINTQLIDYFNKKAAIVSLRDITERKKMEEGMNKLNQELKAKVEELEKFNKLAIGRELKMMDLKKKIKELEEELKNK